MEKSKTLQVFLLAMNDTPTLKPACFYSKNGKEYIHNQETVWKHGVEKHMTVGELIDIAAESARLPNKYKICVESVDVYKTKEESGKIQERLEKGKVIEGQRDRGKKLEIEVETELKNGWIKYKNEEGDRWVLERKDGKLQVAQVAVSLEDLVEIYKQENAIPSKSITQKELQKHLERLKKVTFAAKVGGNSDTEYSEFSEDGVQDIKDSIAVHILRSATEKQDEHLIRLAKELLSKDRQKKLLQLAPAASTSLRNVVAHIAEAQKHGQFGYSIFAQNVWNSDVKYHAHIDSVACEEVHFNWISRTNNKTNSAAKVLPEQLVNCGLGIYPRTLQQQVGDPVLEMLRSATTAATKTRPAGSWAGYESAWKDAVHKMSEQHVQFGYNVANREEREAWRILLRWAVTQARVLPSDPDKALGCKGLISGATLILWWLKFEDERSKKRKIKSKIQPKQLPLKDGSIEPEVVEAVREVRIGCRIRATALLHSAATRSATVHKEQDAIKHAVRTFHWLKYQPRIDGTTETLKEHQVILSWAMAKTCNILDDRSQEYDNPQQEWENATKSLYTVLDGTHERVRGAFKNLKFKNGLDRMAPQNIQYGFYPAGTLEHRKRYRDAAQTLSDAKRDLEEHGFPEFVNDAEELICECRERALEFLAGEAEKEEQIWWDDPNNRVSSAMFNERDTNNKRTKAALMLQSHALGRQARAEVNYVKASFLRLRMSIPQVIEQVGGGLAGALYETPLASKFVEHLANFFWGGNSRQFRAYLQAEVIRAFQHIIEGMDPIDMNATVDRDFNLFSPLYERRKRDHREWQVECPWHASRGASVQAAVDTTHEANGAEDLHHPNGSVAADLGSINEKLGKMVNELSKFDQLSQNIRNLEEAQQKGLGEVKGFFQPRSPDVSETDPGVVIGAPLDQTDNDLSRVAALGLTPRTVSLREHIAMKERGDITVEQLDMFERLQLEERKVELEERKVELVRAERFLEERKVGASEIGRVGSHALSPIQQTSNTHFLSPTPNVHSTQETASEAALALQRDHRTRLADNAGDRRRSASSVQQGATLVEATLTLLERWPIGMYVAVLDAKATELLD
eukprot:COSAG02_NODE_3811_length_6194_cov_2.390320_3_plen_1086_part_00